MKHLLPNLDSSLFRINLPTAKPAVGKLLVAEPFLREEHFNHAVITLVEYDPHDTSMGIVLNKPTGMSLGQAVEGFDEYVDIPIFCGGPVGTDRLFYIHTLPDEFPGSQPLDHHLYIGGDFDCVKNYVNMGLPTEGKIRFFVGYSGWEPGQLDREVSKHVWAVAPQPTTARILYDDSESFWYDTVRSMGEPYRNWLYHPINPILN